MSTSAIVSWTASERALVPNDVNQPQAVVEYAVQLADREKLQVIGSLQSGSYELATTFVWSKAMSALRRRVASLGMDFVGQMLGRPDITADSSIDRALTEFQLISLAEDLGIFTPTEALRVRHAHELVSHFSSLSGGLANNEQMRMDEALSCMRTSVDAILGHHQIEVPSQFIEFRERLRTQSLTSDSGDTTAIQQSPLFFKRATISILLALLEGPEGAAKEHARRNIEVIFPAIWDGLPLPMRWNIGNEYARLRSAGEPRASDAKSVGRALVDVKGFDYVPENLRSATYVAAAQEIMAAHDGWNNYRNEPGPLRRLLALGTSIPAPALPQVTSASMCVFLGNAYGHSYEGVTLAESILKMLDAQGWLYVLTSCVPLDREVLYKLLAHTACRRRWCLMTRTFRLAELLVGRNDAVSVMVKAGAQDNVDAILNAASAAYRAAAK